VKTPKVRGLRTIKKDILKLIDTYIECATDLVSVNENMITPFFEVVLSDYRTSVDIVKDAEVLDVIATMVKKLGVS
jgi:exportin-1